MKRHLLVALAAVFVVGMAASAAHAQCAFQHPKKAGKLQSNLVQAMVSCGNPGGNTVNSMTEGNVPACKPPQTFSNKAGNDSSGGWKWDPEKAQGKLTFKAKKSCAAKGQGTAVPACNPSSPLNTGPPPAADLEVDMTLKGIVSGPGAGTGPASGTGNLATVARATLDDRMNGDVTVVVPDPTRRLPGRGASLHLDPACYALAERRRAFGRALRVAGVLDTDQVREYVAELSTTGRAGTRPHSEEK